MEMLQSMEREGRTHLSIIGEGRALLAVRRPSSCPNQMITMVERFRMRIISHLSQLEQVQGAEVGGGYLVPVSC